MQGSHGALLTLGKATPHFAISNVTGDGPAGRVGPVATVVTGEAFRYVGYVETTPRDKPVVNTVDAVRIVVTVGLVPFIYPGTSYAIAWPAITVGRVLIP